MEILITVGAIVACILLFSFAIFIHEFGHFVVAKWLGLRVDRFSIGFGPALWKKTVGEVEYRISAIPFGGYVALPQMGVIPILEGKEDETLQPISFTSKFLVAVMGAVFNILFAIISMTNFERI